MKSRRFVMILLATLTVMSAASVISAQSRSEDRRHGTQRRHRPIVTALRSVLTTVSNATDLTAQEIVQQLAEGKTLAAVITEHNGSVETVTATLMTQVSDRLAQAVESGRITQAQADEMSAAMATRLDELLNRVFERLSERGLPRERRNSQPENEI